MTHKEYTLQSIEEYFNTLSPKIQQIIKESQIEFETIGELQYYANNIVE